MMKRSFVQFVKRPLTMAIGEERLPNSLLCQIARLKLKKGKIELSTYTC